MTRALEVRPRPGGAAGPVGARLRKPVGNIHGTRWRGKLPVPAHAHPLVRQLFRELNRQRTTVTEVALRAGLRRATVSDWRYRREPTLSNFVAVLEVLDLTLMIRSR